MTREQETEAKRERSKKLGFEMWVRQPAIKALISLVPSTENSDVFMALLQSSYEAGVDCGVATIILDVLTANQDKGI